MFSFIFTFLAISNQVINKICICEGTCPSDKCKNAEQIITSSSTNLDDEFNNIKTENMDVFFTSSSSPFTFSLSTFSDTTTSFHSISETASIIVNVLDKVNANISFSGLSLKFSGSESFSTLQTSSLSIKESSVQFVGFSSCKITTGSLYTDYTSIQPFGDVTITGGQEYSKTHYLIYDVTSNFKPQITISDSSLNVNINGNTHLFSFTDSKCRIAKVNTSSTSQGIVISKSGNANIINMTLDGFNDYTFSEGSWTNTNIINILCTKYNLVLKTLANILPCTINAGSRNATVTVSQQNTQITGNITASTTFFNTTYTTPRVTIEVLGEFNSNGYLTTSYIDLTIETFTKHSYSFDCPFTFTIGKEGTSSVTVKNAKSTEDFYVTYSTIMFALEFDHFLDDSELPGLINKNLSLLDMNGVHTYSNPSPSFINAASFIHGFNSRDCLLKINSESTSSRLKYSIYVPSLDETPLTLCVGSCFIVDCPVITKDELKELTTKYFVPGIKKLVLNVQTPLDKISLTEFDSTQTNLDVKIVGTSYLDDSISEIDFGDEQKLNEHVSNLTLEELTLGGDLFINVKNVTIINCENRSDTAISFANGVNVTSNDMFITNLAPTISGTISNFTYLMDHFETITFLDDSYILEDRESNYQKATVKYSLFQSFHIIFDVGVRLSTTMSNVYLIAQTNKTPDISVSFSTFEYKYQKRAQLIFQNWSNTKNPGKIDFYHSDFPVNIVLTEPILPSTLKVYGSGEVTYVTDYSDAISICAYKTSDENCPEEYTKVEFNEITNFISGREEDYVTVYVVGGDNNNHLSINMKTLNNKQIKFIGDSNNQQYLEFNKNDLQLDTKYTSTSFENLIIGIDQSAKPDSLLFGELQFINCTLSNDLNEVTLNVDDFNTNYETLYKFKDIVIADNLVVSGNLVNQDKTIKFTPDENSEDLKATISEDTTITLGESYVKIGQTSFQIEKSQNFDIILIPNNVHSLEFKYEHQADVTKIPFVRIQDIDGMTFRFTGDWHALTISQKYIISIGKANDFTVYASSENIPLECESITGKFELIALAEKVGITGVLKFNPSFFSSTIFSYDNSTINNCKISLKGGMYTDNDISVKLLQPNLELYIPTIHKIKTDSKTSPKIQFIFYVNEKGNSFIAVDNLDNTEISDDWDVQFNINGNLDDEAVKKFISSDTILLVTTASIIPKIKVDSFSFSSSIHGINKDTFNITADLANNRIVLRNIISPYSIPFNLCLSNYAECEINLNDQTIESFSDFLPSSDGLNIEFSFQYSPGDHVLNFDIEKFNNINLTIKGPTFDSPYPITCTFGQNKILNLQVNAMNVTVTDSFKINNVYLADKGIFLPPTDINGIQNLKIDFSSYSFDLFQTFPNNLTINFNKDLLYSIKFNSDGWTISGSNQFNDTFKKTDFPNLCFNLSGSQRPILNVAKGLTQVQNVKIVSSHKYFQIGPDWNTVTGPEIDITLLQDFQSIVVETYSFPFRPFSKSLMIANYVEFSQDILPLTINESITFNNENYNISFDNIYDSSKAHVYLDEIIFEGNSSLVFEDVKSSMDSLPGKIQHIVVSDSSIGSISYAEVKNILQIKENGTFIANTNNFGVNEAIIKLQWSLNKMPRFEFLDSSFSDLKLPKGVEINFDGSSISGQENDYNNFLYQHSFNLVSGISSQVCQNWLSNISFNSPVKYFTKGDDLILNVSCNNENLLLIGRKKIPSSAPTDSSSPSYTSTSSSYSPPTVAPTSSDSPDASDSDDSGSSDKSKTKKIGVIVGVVMAVLVVVATVTTVFIIYRKRRMSHELLNTTPLNDEGNSINPPYDL